MYAKYFGLAELPFRILPDPRFLWYSGQHQEAKQKIIYHINESAGPIYLLAEIGTGKTTIAKRIAEELEPDKSKRIVFVFFTEAYDHKRFPTFYYGGVRGSDSPLLRSIIEEF